MPYYFPSGIVSNLSKVFDKSVEVGYDLELPNIMASYAFEKDFCKYILNGLISNGLKNIIFDSGAYTAFTTGISIDLKSYIVFLKEQEKYWNRRGVNVYAVSLDIIPGNPSIAFTTQKDLQEACQQGWDNYLYMKERFDRTRIIHVYHQFDPIVYLRKIVEENIIVGLSSRKALGASLSVNSRRSWLKGCFEILKEEKRKVHGFGESVIDFWELPFYSIDSAGYQRSGAYRSLITNKGYISLSERSSDFRFGNSFFIEEAESENDKTKSSRSNHYNNLSKLEKEILNQEFFEIMGFSLEDSFTKSNYYIMLFNMIQIKKLAIEKMVTWEDYKNKSSKQRTFEI